MTTRSYHRIFFVLAFFVLSVDLVSKYVVFRWLYQGTKFGVYDIVPGVFQFYVDYLPDKEMCDCWFVRLNGPVPPKVNHGALYGLGAEKAGTANGFFAAVSALAAVAVAWWGTRPSVRRDPVLTISLGLILGGTIGNLYDRIVFGGVRDFLHWYLFKFPVFNVADSCLVCGACLLLFHAAFLHKDENEAPLPVPPATPAPPPAA